MIAGYNVLIIKVDTVKEEMHPYRSHTCGALREGHVGTIVRLSGWIHSKRDHGNLVFIDLRDEFGLTQCVIDVSSPLFHIVEAARVESVITVTGPVVERSEDTVNLNIDTGKVEVQIGNIEVESAAEVLPMLVAGEQEFGEDIRLRYRFLDLRREQLHKNIRLRSNVIASIRHRMTERGFWKYKHQS